MIILLSTIIKLNPYGFMVSVIYSIMFIYYVLTQKDKIK